ncbi:MAG: hypothetical protein NTX48_18775 [Planctomycetales bacterium]|nr:hypothetical protein [Planctomycetales bacterium]
MKSLDYLYIEILRLGLILLRDAVQSGNSEWSRQEVEHLHEVPSLIGDMNSWHHLAYWEMSQGPYREWVQQQDADVQDCIFAFYETVWTKMRPHMTEITSRT